jgi:CRISPR system Cascade subunit CasA
MSVVLLGEAGRELRAAAIDAVGDADKAAQALGNLAANLVEATGGEGTGPRDRAREIAYAQLDPWFRSWLADLGPGTSPVAARTRWQETADRVVRQLGRELIDQAGPAAWQGREVRGRHVSTPEADNWFRLQLHRTFTYAHQDDAHRKEETGVPA